MITKNGAVPIKGGQYKLLPQDQLQDLQDLSSFGLHSAPSIWNVVICLYIYVCVI
jgi:hypothetical protein